ncbi:IGR protein motif-domain-containing protein [Fusarium tricinctum]|uniref:Small ribosomal subunit protein mS41 n=1 Tax=Fusarium tricinctum TaxID=61284 RepID=A0A8K0S4R9_9HYPO|nr:IGR protein motif-domain-containing protein [Fusarium tricinctum]
MKGERLRSTFGLLLQSGSAFSRTGQIRQLHKTRPAHPIPKPRPFVPDVPTFLTLIGRGLNKYANKFPSWNALFSLTSPQLKELGIEPPRNRKYLLHWMQRYRNGSLGPGGDFQYVKDGEAILKVATPPPSALSDTKWVVNVPAEFDPEAPSPKSAPKKTEDGEDTGSYLVRPNGYKVVGHKTIAGPYAKPLPGVSGVVVKVTEGMWEDKQGRKIDGGERRRAETRFKKRSAERRAEREAELLANM